MKDLVRFMNIQLFSADVNPINVTTQETMSPTMKTFYDTTLLENAREQMVFTQFGKKQPLHGNKVEWRRFNTFEPSLNPLQEGVIPTGKTFGMTKIEAETSREDDRRGRRLFLLLLPCGQEPHDRRGRRTHLAHPPRH